MRSEDELLESLGLNVSDGEDPGWENVEASIEGDDHRRVVHDLRSVSKIAEYYRRVREESDPTSGGRASGSGPGLPPGARWGHLEILGQIGSGSFGEVYRARDTHLDREVALKILRPVAPEDRDLPSALIEGERLARVKHPHLVVVHGADRIEGRSGIWMEYLQGTTLHSMVQEKGPLGAKEAIPIGIDLCGALASLHAAGLLHRDIKAQNVIREQGGRIVLMDLGSGAEIEDRLPGTGTRLSGTPLYMAPEVMNGAAATVRSDLYSLGVLLYYAVSGRYPVGGGSLAELREHHARQERRPLRDVRPDLPSSFVAVVERALAPDPGSRFASAGELERALLAVSQPGPSHRNGNDLRRRSWRPSRLGLLAALFGASAVIAVVLFLLPGVVGRTTYTVEARLQRIGPGGVEPLLPGARVSPGDRLVLDFEASRPLHLYVLAEDDVGASFLLFPLPGHRPGNPLSAGESHRLPPAREGRSYSWGVSSAGGTEHILLVASPNPLLEFESELEQLATPTGAAPPPALPLGKGGLAGLRGIGQLLETPSSRASESGSLAFEMARKLGDGSERHRGIWVRQIDLTNPGS